MAYVADLCFVQGYQHEHVQRFYLDYRKSPRRSDCGHHMTVQMYLLLVDTLHLHYPSKLIPRNLLKVNCQNCLLVLPSLTETCVLTCASTQGLRDLYTVAYY